MEAFLDLISKGSDIKVAEPLLKVIHFVLKVIREGQIVGDVTERVTQLQQGHSHIRAKQIIKL